VSALDDALLGAALVDLSSWARLRATGPAFLGLLHRLSTGEVERLAPGEGRTTVVTTPKGRILAKLVVLHFGDEGILTLSGPATSDRLLAHLTKYALGEDIGVSDVTGSTKAYAVVGPRWTEVAKAMGVSDLAPYATATTASGTRVARTNGFDDEGLLILSDGSLPEALPRLSPADFEAWRILTGRPLAGHELTEEYNPLEAGLREAVSFTKGCYTGQEVVARLNTYDKVAREIVRLELPGAGLPPVGARLLLGEREVGTITSAAPDPRSDTTAALAYVKKRDVPKGTEVVDVVWDGGEASARIVRR
jgi:folate-binding protein YgfZ